MRTMLAICLMLAAAVVFADDAAIPAASTAVEGVVLEVKNVESYTYLRLSTKDGETWAAVNKAPVKKGSKVTIENPTVMHNFESKSLKTTFKQIVFGNLAGSPGSPAGDRNGMAAAHAGMANPAPAADIHVAKASGANAHTVGEVAVKGAELKDKQVLVRGQVVKFNPNIMGKNWIHLRDGTGSAADNTNDILVTSTDQVKVGDVVTIKGIVRTDKDFGAGYAYKVLIEEATLQR
jgi:hypothetical protein